MQALLPLKKSVIDRAHGAWHTTPLTKSVYGMASGYRELRYRVRNIPQAKQALLGKAGCSRG